MTGGNAPEARWTALVLAGQRPGIDPLADAFGAEWKALIPVGGLPMLDRVLRTLLACPEIDRIVVAGQAPDALAQGWRAAEPRLSFTQSQGGISRSIAAVAGTPTAPWPVLVTTADHPLLTPDMVAAFLTGAGEADVAVGMVERRTMLAAYPDAKRTWLHFRGGAYSGANLFALRTPRAQPALALWAQAEQDRKRALKLFWHFGPLLALRAVTRTISGPNALRTAGRRLGLDARLVALPQAEAAIDVDKPADHTLAERILAAHQADART
ncbi:CTP:molybdopterin cytidylyltransferase MocA [Sphingomonas prati]|uniref:CTP:molybdopterin cytidylyltransferase MocA n=2 Tax=Sphingomonas prati TaxID=1843237 RepID=A0A7W9F088_9SPHN|nr:nucleotidyltransferase family protein [Sphingomonas prati]MBB5727983.1 CTP:molybdopterin cytidylyltransferase MocA [Sphingomonas prati]